MTDEKNKSLRILHLEDSPLDTEIIREGLISSGILLEMDWASNEQEFTAFLKREKYDLVLADFMLPSFDAPAALALAKSISPGIPFIVVSGAIGEEKAVEILKQGATDFVSKDRLVKLPIAIERALEEVREHRTRQQAEAALKESEARYADLYENAPDMYISVNAGTTLIEKCNLTLLGTLGYSREEVIGRPVFELFHPDCLDDVKSVFQLFLEMGEIHDRDLQLKRIDDTKLDVSLNVSSERDKDGNVLYGRLTLRDITERKRNSAINASRLHLMQFAATHTLDELLEETLNEAEKLTDSLIGFCNFVDDDQGSLTFQNWSTRTKAEFCKVEGKGMHYPIDKAGVWAECVKKRKPVIHNDCAALPNRRGMPEGHAEVVRELVVPVVRGKSIKAILGVGNKSSDYVEKDIEAVSLLADLVWEIAERKYLDDALRQSQQRYRDIFDNVLDGLYLLEVTEDGRFRNMEINPALERATGIPRSMVIGKTQEECVPEEVAEIVNAKYRHCVEARHPIEEEAELALPSGKHYFHSTLIPAYDETGRVNRIIGISRDITERKYNEVLLLRLNRELRAISDCNQTLIRAEDEQTLLEDICNIICKEAGYRMAWVGYAENDSDKTVRPVAWAGVEESYLAQARITWADTERGRGPGGTAIRTGQSACIQDFQTDPLAAPWRDDALQRGYRSNIAMPLKDENASTFGILTLYSSEPNAFTPDEVRLLDELAGDLAFGITTLRTRKERARIEEDLRRMNETLEQKVREEVSKNRAKDLIMIQQSRFATMGEMIQNIAHQWRQPLNTLILILENIYEDYEANELTSDNLRKYLTDSNLLVQKMSSTIEDFRRFFKPDSHMEKFTIKSSYLDALTLMEGTLKKRKVSIIFEKGEEITVNGYFNEFSHVLMNVISNAAEAIITNQVKNGKIVFVAERYANEVIIRIKNNGSSIPEDILPRIFDPYYTTKKQGTGIGLFMSKKIVEHMNGHMDARNIENGVEFVITLPKGQDAAHD